MPREMKDSGIEWIGEIPNTWRICRLRYMCNILTGNQDTQDNDPEGEYPFYVRSPFVERSKKYTFEGPAILMAGDGAGAGKIFHYVNGKYGCHQRVYSIQNICGINRRMLYYYLKNNFHIMIDTANSKSTVDSVRLIMLQDFPILLPPLPEQQKISAHLDIECAKIDDVITKTKATIEEYKKLKHSLIMEYTSKGTRRNKPLKPSGLEWISNIPDNWKVTKAKHILTKLERPMLPDDNIVICSNSGKTFYRGEKNTGLVSLTEDGYQGVESGDLLIHGMDTWHGAIAVSNIRGKCTSVVHVCDSKENKYFIAYYLQSLAYRNVYKAITNGVRQNTSDYRSWDKAGTIDIVVPTYEEQCEIVSLLDQKCSEIDNLIAKKEQIVTELESYKKSLIYEYVTGKREVSDMTEKEETITIFDPQAARRMQMALAYKVIKQSGDDLKGRIHLMKIIYMLDCMLGLGLGINYLRYTRGPYNPIIESIEKNLSDKGIISVNTAKNYSYTVIDDSFDSKYNELFAKHNSEIEKIIDYMKRMKSSRAEKIATLYAAWNDMVIDRVQNITDKMIIDDVMNNWTENKAKTDFSTWQHILNDMKDKKIIPHGYGKHTRPRSE